MQDTSAVSIKFFVPDASSMENFGVFLSSLLHPGDFICLIGDLGAGKTTLVRGIAQGLGYSGRVTSPTFTLMNQYDCQPPLVHLDFYRLDSSAMLEDLGLDDYWNRDAVMLIEWPQIGLDSLPEPTMQIQIDLIDEDYDLGREVTLLLPPSQKYLIERLQSYVDTCH